MRTNLRYQVLLITLAVVAACSDSTPSGPAAGAALVSASRRDDGKAHTVNVMTRNLYVGADVDPLIAALASPDPNDDIPALMAAITTLQETSWPTRVEAIADEIARQRPDVIGMQEVDDITIDLRPLGLPVNIELHYLASLQAALAARGLHYEVAGQLLSVTAAPVPGISLLDHDVVLVNTDRVTVEPGVVAQHYAYNVGEVVPGVIFTRGYVRFQATIGGAPVTIMNTHLQDGLAPQLVALRAAQVTELAAALGTASPAIVLGDLNDVPGSPMYGVMAGAGLVDSWAKIHPGAKGLSCCELPDLSNKTEVFDQRIDYVWERGFGDRKDDGLGRIALIGNKPGDKIAGPFFPIWPSDHAGVVATLKLGEGEDLAER